MKTKPLHPQSRKAAQEKKHFHHVQRIAKYLKRAGKKVKTKHGPVSVSTDIKELHLEQEMEEYLTCGIEIPDLSSKINLKNLR
ncbi:hypothetical protein KSF78_0002082 [Schistosoma japonicum]|nr:hypothetical protein KSF78_0002082 [Schistosoma japonicum]